MTVLEHIYIVSLTLAASALLHLKGKVQETTEFGQTEMLLYGI